MKLRVRSSNGGPTHRVEVADVADLRTLRARIAYAVGLPSVNEVRLSLNKRDELTGPDSVSLSTIGICTGDLLYLLTHSSPDSGINSGGGDRSAQILSGPRGSPSPTPSPSCSSSPMLVAGRGISHSSGHLSSPSPSSPSPSSSTSFPSPSSSLRVGKPVEAAAGVGSRRRTTAVGSSSPPPPSLGSNAAAAGSTGPSSSPIHRVDLQRRDPIATAVIRRELCAAAAIGWQATATSSSSLSGSSSSQQPSPLSLWARLPSPLSSPDAPAEGTRMSHLDPDPGNQEEIGNHHQIGRVRMPIDAARTEGSVMETSERMDSVDSVVDDPMITSRSLMGQDGNTSEDSGLQGDRAEAEDNGKGTAMVDDGEALGGGGRGEGGGGDREQEAAAAPDMLERVHLAEIDAVKHDHDLLVIAVHAALLETGLIPWHGAGDNRALASAAGEGIGEPATAAAAAAAAGGSLTGVDVHLPASWSSVEGPLTVMYTLPGVEREERESRAVKCFLCFRQVGGSSVIYGIAAADSGPASPVVHRLTLRHSAYCTDSSLVKHHVDDEQRTFRRRGGSSAVKRTREPDGSNSLDLHDEQQEQQPQAHEGEHQHMMMMDEDEEKAAVAAAGSQRQSQSTSSSSSPAILQDPRARRILLNARRRFSNLRGLWMEAKDCLARPLLMTLRERAGLPPLPSLLALPLDLKMRILELLPAVDLAAVGRTCSELRYLACDDQLWHTLYVQHFGEGGRGGHSAGQTWKLAFARAWRRSVEEGRRREEERRRREEDRRGGLVLLPMPAHLVPRGDHSHFYRHPGRGITGGDYDRLPGGGFGLLEGGRGDGDGFGGGFAGGLGGGATPFGRAREEGRGAEGLRFPPHSPALSEAGLLPGLDMEPPVAGGDGFLNLGPGLLAGPHVVQPGLARGLAQLGGGPPPRGRGAGERVPAPHGPGLHGRGGHGPVL